MSTTTIETQNNEYENPEMEEALKKEDIMTQEMVSDIYLRRTKTTGIYNHCNLYQVQTGAGKTYAAAQGMALSLKYAKEGSRKYSRQFFIASKKNMLPDDHLIFGPDKQHPSDFETVFAKYGVDYDEHVLRLSAQTDYFVCSCSESELKRLRENYPKMDIDGRYILHNGKTKAKYFDRFKMIMDNGKLMCTSLAKEMREKYEIKIDHAIYVFKDAEGIKEFAEPAKKDLGIRIAEMKRECIHELENRYGGEKEEKTARQIAEEIQKHEPWLFQLFPDLCKDLYDILFMTVSKFLESFNPRTDTGSNITTAVSTYLNDSLLYIDEIDSIKEELQAHIVDKSQGTNEKEIDDYLTIFTNILNFEPDIYDKKLTEAVHSAKTSKYNLERIIQLKREIESYTKYQQRYKTDKTISEERYSIFMYRDSFWSKAYLFQRNNNDNTPQIYIAIDKKQKRYAITLDPSLKDEKGENLYTSLRQDKKTTLYNLVNVIQHYFYTFQYFTNAVSQAYCDICNRERKKANPKFYHEMTVNDAFSSVIREFLKNPEMSKTEIDKYKTVLSYRHTEIKTEGIRMDTIEYYQNGFVFLSLKDDDSHNTRTKMLYLSILDTPEKIFLDWLTKCTIVGLSATAEIESVLCNFNWTYIRDEIGEENFHTASERMCGYFRSMNQEMEKCMEEKEEKISVSSIGITGTKMPDEEIIMENMLALYERIRLKNSNVSKKIFDQAAQIINDVPCKLYIKERYFKTFYAMTQFWINGHVAFIHYSMVYPEPAQYMQNKRNAKNAEKDWLIYQELFILASGVCKEEKDAQYLIKRVQEMRKSERMSNNKKQLAGGDETGAVRGIELDPNEDKDNDYYLFRTRAANFEQTKQTIKKIWGKGHPAYLIVSQKTASAGQNYQYDISEFAEAERSELVTTSKRNLQDKSDARYKKVNIDGIYLEKRTNILENVKQVGGLSSASVAKYFCQVNDLYRNGEIENSERQDTTRYVCSLLWRKYYNEKKEKNEPELNSGDEENSAMQKLYKTDSVALAQLAMLEQVIGRMSRSFLDRGESGIYLDEDLVNNLQNNEAVRATMYDQQNRGMMTAKMSRVFTMLLKTENEPVSNKEKKLENDFRHQNISAEKHIDRLLHVEGFGKTWPEISRTTWEKIRDICMKLGPRPLQKDIDAMTEQEKCIIHDFHMFYNVSTLSEETICSLLNGQTTENRWAACRMNILMENPDIRKEFENKGYKTEMESGEYVMMPYVFQSIYLGALGEVAGSIILNKNDIRVAEITDGSIYEKGDRIMVDYPDTLVDFKYTSYKYAKENMTEEQMVSDILNKTNGTQITNFILIETVLPTHESVQMEYWGARNVTENMPDAHTAIYSVPALLDRHGRVLQNGLQCMRAILADIERREKETCQSLTE